MDDKDKVIKNAQYRKGLSIAFFNATNNAIELLKLQLANQDVSKINPQTLLNMVKTGRDWLLDEHKNYYATVIEKIGGNYSATDTIEKLKKTTSKEELTKVWFSLSEDERRDKEIRKCALDLKASYEEAQ
jgi:hypothetical protein